ncbi:ABC transporter permease [Aestuariivirga sp. YIM B02566]|uniref:ABC transporter permease n=1 Tax=Taklimakanibacter albus TaxID=2800327 RepID=A0ACC5R7P1_9HYPH|nr:ABC transporter permease [Aestuariivirga sp. YIM B02566]MBK1868691.1 ABC transporter permease [Aestuariivirga sp. YIM B02566]
MTAASIVSSGRPLRLALGNRRALVALLLLAPALVLYVALYFVPLFDFLSLSVVDGGLSTAHFSTLLDMTYLSVLWRTLWMSALVGAICTALGFPVAYLMSRSSAIGAAAIGACVMVPLWTSVLLRTYAWTVVLQYRGVLNDLLLTLGLIDQPLRFMYSKGAVITVMVHVLLPYVVLPLYTNLASIPRELPTAARGLGATGLRIFIHVTLPLCLPGVIAGFTLVFVLSTGFFVVPSLVGGPASMMVATLIGREISENLNWAQGAAMSVVLLATATVCLAMLSRLRHMDKRQGSAA